MPKLTRHTLAALYLAYVVTSTGGPFDMFKSARETIAHGGLLTCFFCLVFWAALVLRLLPGSVVDALAVAGGASAVYRYTGMHYNG
jgi:hypothetical protein